MEYGEGLLKFIGISPNWIPAASIILQWLMSVISSILLFSLTYIQAGKQKTIALLFLLSGIRYIKLDERFFFHSDHYLLSTLCSLIGVLLIFSFGATFFKPDDEGEDDEDEEDPDPTPDPGNKKIVDDFLKSCQKKFLAGLKQ